MLMLASALRETFGVQLYKNNARALLSRILSILNLDWLQHAHSVPGVYESTLRMDVMSLHIFMLGRTEMRTIVNLRDNARTTTEMRGWNADTDLEAQYEVTSILKVG